jgi:hypothetical protein
MSATTTTTAPLSLTAVRSDPAAFRIRGAPRGDGSAGIDDSAPRGEGTLREQQPGHARPRAVMPLPTIPPACGIFVPATSRRCPRLPPRCSMVRRGSPVRVRKRALNPCKSATCVARSGTPQMMVTERVSESPNCRGFRVQRLIVQADCVSRSGLSFGRSRAPTQRRRRWRPSYRGASAPLRSANRARRRR